jgi:sigma-E factor negative regulatory protein RseC
MSTSSVDKSCHSPQPPDAEQAEVIVVKATVVRQEAGGVWLATPVSTSCSGCQQQDSCSSGLVAKALPKREQQLFLADFDLLPGQQVEISVSPGAILGSALLVYLLPLSIFIAALALGHALMWHELAALGVAMLATALTLLTVRRVEQARAGQLKIRLVRVLPQIAVMQQQVPGASA